MKQELHTAQDILKMPEERYIVAGARMMAKALHKLFYVNEHKEMRNVKTIRNAVQFFAEECRRDELELFIYGIYEAVRLERSGKGKAELRPVKIIPGYSGKSVSPYSFIPEDEQRYRELCRVLLDTLENMAGMIAIMSGRDGREVLCQLVEEVNLKAGKSGFRCAAECTGIREQGGEGDGRSDGENRQEDSGNQGAAGGD